MSSTSTALYNTEIEANSLAIMLKYPEMWGDFYLIDRGDWSEPNRPIYEHIALQLNATPPGSVDPLLLSERMRGSGVTQLLGGFEVFPYLEGLTNRYVEKTQAAHHARELKRLRVRREQIERLESAKRELVSQPNISFEEMGTLVEKSLTSVATDYHKPDVSPIMGDGLIEMVERRAETPIKPEDMLYMGPFPSINSTLGPLIFPSSFTCLIARTGVGKSSLSFFYCVWVATKYDLPILWLDAAEMTVEQLQMRAVCCLSEGRVPLWAVWSGEWRNKPEWRKIVREEVWPKVKRLRMEYKNVGAMSPREKIAFIRRYYFNKIGRGNFLIIGDDYLKGVEQLANKNSQEYQAMGYYVGGVKSLVTDEIHAGYWTSLQGNRSIITQGKKASELNDSGEAGAGISDRVIQQSTNSFLMRYKIPEELGDQKNLFGNICLKKAKLREAYGKNYEKIARPLKLPNGSFTENYWHLEARNFFYLDKGLHSDAMSILGQTATNVAGDGKAPGAPL